MGLSCVLDLKSKPVHGLAKIAPRNNRNWPVALSAVYVVMDVFSDGRTA
jgi:hypothetical protein